MSDIKEFNELIKIVEHTGRDLPIIQIIRPNGISKYINQILLRTKPVAILDCKPFGVHCNSTLVRSYSFTDFVKNSIDSILETLKNDKAKRKIKELSYTRIYNPQYLIGFIDALLKVTDDGSEKAETFTMIINNPLELVLNMPLFLYTLLTIHYEIPETKRHNKIDPDD